MRSIVLKEKDEAAIDDQNDHIGGEYKRVKTEKEKSSVLLCQQIAWDQKIHSEIGHGHSERKQQT
jgi:hypothetical protein